jgi:hypothetical protein
MKSPPSLRSDCLRSADTFIQSCVSTLAMPADDRGSACGPLGSVVWPDAIELAIESIECAAFLTKDQNRDSLLPPHCIFNTSPDMLKEQFLGERFYCVAERGVKSTTSFVFMEPGNGMITRMFAPFVALGIKLD